MYQQTRLLDTSAIGNPGSLPDVIETWTDPAMLADLTGRVDPQFGFDGIGFWPVIVTTPIFDATKRSFTGTVTLGAADPKARVWAATADVRDLTAAEAQAAYLAANPVPEIISDRQCFQQLAVLGKVTQDEALAAVTVGSLPKVVTDGIDALPAEQQFPAKMMLCGATQFFRSHPMTPVFGRFMGMDGTALDALWRAAAQI